MSFGPTTLGTVGGAVEAGDGKGLGETPKMHHLALSSLFGEVRNLDPGELTKASVRLSRLTSRKWEGPRTRVISGEGGGIVVVEDEIVRDRCTYPNAFACGSSPGPIRGRPQISHAIMKGLLSVSLKQGAGTLGWVFRIVVHGLRAALFPPCWKENLAVRNFVTRQTNIRV